MMVTINFTDATSFIGGNSYHLPRPLYVGAASIYNLSPTNDR